MRRDDPGLSWRSLHPMTSAPVRGHREEKEQGTMGAGNHGSREPWGQRTMEQRTMEQRTMGAGNHGSRERWERWEQGTMGQRTIEHRTMGAENHGSREP